MKNNKQIAAIVFATVIILSGLFYLFYNPDKFKWYEIYYVESKEPYGTFVIKEMLQKKHVHFSEMKNKISNTLSDSTSGMNYLFIGETPYYDSSDYAVLFDFVAAGNNAFIAVNGLPDQLMYRLYNYDCYPSWYGLKYEYDSVVHKNLIHPKRKLNNNVKYDYYYKDKLIKRNWSYFDERYFCEESQYFMRLGYYVGSEDSTRIDFIKLQYGNGYFYLHCNPLVFTNFYLKKQQNFEYAQNVFNHLPDNTAYYDYYSQLPYFSKKNSYHGTREGPLKYLLMHNSFKYAWYLFVLAGVLFIVFRSKRRQRIIPVMDQNSNTSLEFVKMVGRLYYTQRNINDLCNMLAHHFKIFVRNKYQFKQNDSLELLAKRSGVDIEIIQKIFNYFNYNSKTKYTLTESELLPFYAELEKFYKQCK